MNEESTLIQLLLQRGLITEHQKSQLQTNNKNERIKGAVGNYEDGGTSLSELAESLRDILSFLQPSKTSENKKRILEQPEEEFGESLSSDEEWNEEVEEDEENMETKISDVDLENNLPDFGEELEPTFNIDGNKLLKDPQYTLLKVNEVLEKNCQQKRKRQKRLEFMWDLIIGKQLPPSLPESLFEKNLPKDESSLVTSLPNNNLQTVV